MDLQTDISSHEGGQAANESQNDPELTAGSIICRYLLQHVPEYQRLSDLRQKGWDNPSGDTYFQQQRRNADVSDERTRIFFYQMMVNISIEMHRATGALSVRTDGTAKPQILDFCMAPGGFLSSAVRLNRNADVSCFSLPEAEGGHKILGEGLKEKCKEIDITMLAADMGATTIPAGHPDADKFLPQHFQPDQKFDLVLCDGQVLRTHERAPYREQREGRRLTLTQLALGLEHARPGATIVALLHKLEAWDCANLLKLFSGFSRVQLFKARRYHAKRSSFYMICTEVQSQHAEAIAAVQRWKKEWQVATFGTDDEYSAEIRTTAAEAQRLCDEFGQQLAAHGREIWSIQADALARAPFMRA